ncbi:TMV resistance protein N-like isoform X3 [Quercus lobata]|uniref:TMV resistance protein N-like isoform X3 n=1 Tax=Quercus lobata TaxID=97700 RepID=UPI0012470BEE|nr:TMV resistance protein N-like isoform X3 [Quercus lobata]
MAFMGTESASSSSSSTMSGWTYDVFLSFRGSDTRKNFTDHLYAALKQKGIFTFRDDEKLERGTFIAPELLRAIEESRFAVVIISQDYASSSWCLVELAKIVECMEEERLIILPVFHYIDPSDVRNLKETFGEAFAKHEEHYKDNIEEVYRWKAALTQVAKIAGWDLRDKHEAKVVEEIVGKILDKLTSTYSIVHKDFVGINSRMEELVNLLGMGLNDVRFIGIWGMGGLGKTTLARVVYDKFRNRFEGSSFLANVREECGKHGLVHLKKQLLSDILIERNIDFSDVQWGSNVIEKRLCYKSVLIVLDDVDQLDQLEELAGERIWFGRGSRVIITTRDQHLLIKHDVARAEIYEATKLNSDEALQLFSRKAFKKDHPLEGYVELSKKAISYAQGLPLALNVLGPFLKHRSPDAWKSALDRLKETPPKKVLDTLRISFDGLEETEKKIFLDIACFFKGEDKDRVINILQTPRYKPSIDIDVLVEKSLITIFNNYLWMHDLLQELGWQIVHSEFPEQPGSRSRLCLKDDVLHVLKNNTGSGKIRGIMLHSPGPVKVQLHTEAFRNMENLKFLIVENVHICEPLEFLPHKLIFLKWPNYPFHWPSEYFPEQLVAIEMPHSRIRLPKLITQERPLENLKDVNLSLQHGISSVVENFKFFQASSDRSGIREVPSSIEHLTELVVLNLRNCKNLGDLPHSIYKLQQLRELSIPTAKLRPTCDSFDGSSGYGFVNMTELILLGCEGIIELDLLMKPDYFPALEAIFLSSTNIVTIPESISRFPRLIQLSATNCKLLREIQGLPQSIRSVHVDNSRLLNTSPSGLFNQVIGIIGILPNRVCGSARSNKLMDLQFSNNLPSETKATEWVDFWGESFDGFDPDITFSGTEMLKWFNHRSVDNSIFFFVGRNFPKLVVCIVPGPKRFQGFVEISINGYENREYQSIDLRGDSEYSCSQYLFSLTQWSLLQRHLNESNPTDQNRVKVSIRYKSDDTCYSIRMWGVHVECTCPPQEDDAVDYGYSIKGCGSKKQRTR